MSLVCIQLIQLNIKEVSNMPKAKSKAKKKAKSKKK